MAPVSGPNSLGVDWKRQNKGASIIYVTMLRHHLLGYWPVYRVGVHDGRG